VSLAVPASLASDYERFVIHERLEIVSTLRRLLASREPLSVHWDGNDGFALTALLAVNVDFEELVLDCLGDARANRRLLESEELTLGATMDGVKVQFSARRAEPTVFEGGVALRVRLPEMMMRLQRRETFRVRAPLSCQLALDVDGRLCVFEVRVADLSLGGVSLTTDRSYVSMEPGKLLENCRIALGALGTLAVDLEVRNVIESRSRTGARQLRFGCRFVALPRAMENLVSRYIAQLERNRRVRA
jgi:c-di-GMP-binding flagellar brake protein YcgR